MHWPITAKLLRKCFAPHFRALRCPEPLAVPLQESPPGEVHPPEVQWAAAMPCLAQCGDRAGTPLAPRITRHIQKFLMETVMLYQQVDTAVIDGESLPWVPFTPYSDDVLLKYFKLDPVRGEFIVL